MKNKNDRLRMIDMHPDIRDWLRKQARAKGISDEEMVNDILEEYMQKHGNDYSEENGNGYYRETIDELLKILRKF